MFISEMVIGKPCVGRPRPTARLLLTTHHSQYALSIANDALPTSGDNQSADHPAAEALTGDNLSKALLADAEKGQLQA
jgi:hypothetical protein